jgi:hypothetical protein
VPRLPRGNAPSSKWNLSSVWVGNLSFVERTDQSATGTGFFFLCSYTWQVWSIFQQ